ncbi:MAG: SigE family RNA polymerase sigma factor [Acidimicrobiales bacterium]
MGAYDEGLVEFCHDEYTRLVGTLTLYTGDADLALDLTQGALARVCREWDTVSTMDAPGAWAHRVAINLANSTFRRRAVEWRHARRRRSTEVAPPSDGAESLALRAAVADLPRRQRAAVVLRYWRDLSVDDTAEVMGCAPGTVRALTHQGITRLRELGLTDHATTRQGEV